MRNTPVGSRALVATFAVAAAVLGGCASAIDAKLIYGTYDVTVSAFGKSDPDIVVASQGSDGAIVFYFTYGVTTDFDATNATGLRVDINGDSLELKKQPIHVDYSTGTIDGTVTGKGSTGGASIDLTLDVIPSNVNFVQPDGTMLPANTPIEYKVTGPKQT